MSINDNDIRSIISNDPTTAAMYSKLVQSVLPAKPDGTGRKEAIMRGAGGVAAIAELQKSRVSGNEDAIAIFPDLTYMAQIMTSAVMAPNDMVTTNLIVGCECDRVPEVPRRLVCEAVKRTMVREYGAEDEVYRIIHDVLFDRGAFVKVIIPESSLDDIIHSRGISAESASGVTARVTQLVALSNINTDYSVRNLGFIIPKVNPGAQDRMTMVLGMESFFNGVQGEPPTENGLFMESANKEQVPLGVELIDNFNVLKLPRTMAKMHEIRNRQVINRFRGMRTESAKPKADASDAYAKARMNLREIVSIGTEQETSRRSIGRSMVLDWPMESVVPIYTPGEPNKHHAYIFLVDRTGSPITADGEGITHDLIGSSITSAVQGGGALARDLNQRAKANGQDISGTPYIDNILEIYSQAMDEEINRALQRSGINGVFKSDRLPGLAKVMLFRTLQNSMTRMLYVPSELVQYFAHRYHKNGVGRSYMDDMRVLLTLRAGYYIARILGSIKNSIAVTRANVTIDEEDTDPTNTLARLLSLIAETRANWLPQHNYDINGLTSWVQQLGVEVQIAEHPMLPGTKVEYDNVKMDHAIPDEELEEYFRTQCSLVVGVPPEMVDAAKGPDFATTVQQQNLLMAKRAYDIQKALNPHWSGYFRKVLTNDQILRNEVVEILRDHISTIKEAETDKKLLALAENDENAYVLGILDDIVDNLDVKLPPPKMTSQVLQSEAFNSFMESAEKAIDYVYSSNVIPESMAGDLSQSVDDIKNQYLAFMARDWMAKNGYMPELAELTGAAGKDAEGTAVSATIVDYVLKAMQATNHLMQEMVSAKAAANKDVEARGGAEGSTDMSSDSSDDNSDDAGGDDGFGGDGGDDPFAAGGSDDMDGAGAADDSADSDASTDEEPPAAGGDDADTEKKEEPSA